MTAKSCRCHDLITLRIRGNTAESDKASIWLAPRPGLEPGTCGLTGIFNRLFLFNLRPPMLAKARARLAELSHIDFLESFFKFVWLLQTNLTSKTDYLELLLDL